MLKCCFRPSAKVLLPSFNIPNVWGIRCARYFLWDGSSKSILKWLCFCYFFYFSPLIEVLPWKPHWSIIRKQLWSLIKSIVGLSSLGRPRPLCILSHIEGNVVLFFLGALDHTWAIVAKHRKTFPFCFFKGKHLLKFLEVFPMKSQRP